MRFHCIIATRRNPLGAAAVMQTARALASGEHEIAFTVAHDLDDLETNHFFYQIENPFFHVSSDKRPLGVGAVWNRCVKPEDDYIIPLPDDAFIATPDWDAFIHGVFEEMQIPEPLRVLAWNDMANPNQCSLPIFSKGWHELAGFYDDRFPFWFYDTAFSETWSFVTGQRVIIPPSLVLTAKKGLTKSLRDVEFWWDFYVATRRERLFKAAEIRKKLGIDLPPWKLADVLRGWARRDVEGKAAALGYEQKMSAERGPPSDHYLKAKAVAESYMAKADEWMPQVEAAQ